MKQLKIYRPVSVNNITQKFGDDKVCTQVMDSGKPYVPYRTVNMPTIGHCPVGYKSLYKTLGVEGHTGMDFAARHGDTITFNVDADVEWEVMKTNTISGGYGILVRSLEPIPLENVPIAEGASMDLIGRQYEQLGGAVHLMFYFGHLLKPSRLKDRSVIKFGDKVGIIGTSGASTGPHTHFDMRVCGTNEINPFFYLDGDGDYKGRLPMAVYYENESAHEVYRLRLKKEALSLRVILLRLRIKISELNNR